MVAQSAVASCWQGFQSSVDACAGIGGPSTEVIVIAIRVSTDFMERC